MATCDDASFRTTAISVGVLAVIPAFIQNLYFGMSYLETFVVVLVELPLLLIAVRVLGATNFGPVSAPRRGYYGLDNRVPNRSLVRLRLSDGAHRHEKVQRERRLHTTRRSKEAPLVPRRSKRPSTISGPSGCARCFMKAPGSSANRVASGPRRWPPLGQLGRRAD